GLVGRSRGRNRSHLGVGRSLLGFGALLLGGSRLGLCDFLGLLGGDARLFGGFGVGFGLGLRGLLGAFGGQPRTLLLGSTRLFGRGHAGIFGGELLELQFGQVRIEAVGILREESVQCGLVADLQRKLIVAAHVGLRARNRSCRCWCCNLRRGHQRHILAAQRTIDERLLAVVGGL